MRVVLPLVASLLATGTLAGMPKKVTGLQYRGHDFSSLLELEQSRNATFVKDGNVTSAESILAAGGANLARIRVFTGAEYGLDNAIALAKRAKSVGMDIFVDFHYSDTWADPGHQTMPAGWPTTLPELTAKIWTYTRDSIAAFAAQNITVDIVSIGNEIAQGILWPVGSNQNGSFEALSQLLASGAHGAKMGNPSNPPKILIHLHNGWDWGLQQWWWDKVQVSGALTLDKVDYMGVSFYPFYDTRATFAALNNSLSNMANRYKVPLMVVETDFPMYCSDTIPLSEVTWPGVWGQQEWLKGIANVVKNVPNGLGKGLIYWEPTWVTNAALGSGCWDNTLFDCSWEGTKPTCTPRDTVNIFKSL